MAKILVLLAHPVLEKSRVHAELARVARSIDGLTLNDLYQVYPDFGIDTDREKRLLLEHDIIVWQHPLYWYSAPPLLKQWQDLVLEHGWAYGKKGMALSGKKIFNVLSSGGGQGAYDPEGFNKYTIHEFLRPFERTAGLCRMHYWPPFWIPGVHRMDPVEIQGYVGQYRKMMTALAHDMIPEAEITAHALMNDVFPNSITYRHDQ